MGKSWEILGQAYVFVGEWSGMLGFCSFSNSLQDNYRASPLTYNWTELWWSSSLTISGVNQQVERFVVKVTSSISRYKFAFFLCKSGKIGAMSVSETCQCYPLFNIIWPVLSIMNHYVTIIDHVYSVLLTIIVPLFDHYWYLTIING